MATPSATSTSATSTSATSIGDTNTTITTTSPQKRSPTFAGLPTELRLQIYRTALQDIIDEVLANNEFEPGWLKYRGALALLHTNRSFRAESAREMLPIVQVEWIVSGMVWQSFDDAMHHDELGDMEDEDEEGEDEEGAEEEDEDEEVEDEDDEDDEDEDEEGVDEEDEDLEDKREVARQQRVAMGEIKAMLDKCLAGLLAAAA